MIDRKNDFREFAKKLLDWVRETEDAPRIFAQLTEADEVFGRLRSEDFKKEYASARAALGCLSWEDACVENRLVPLQD